MGITRRGFIRQTLMVGPVALVFGREVDLAWAAECGMPVQGADCTLPTPPPAQRFIPNEPKVLVRYSAGEMADPGRATQLQQFRDAICMVRNLPGTDVIGWTKLVAQHCIWCAQTNPNNIHFNWQFLPWHRGLLYFLERSLRALSKHDDLRLCYWDWESSQSRTLPAIYAPAGQPLYWKNRFLGAPNWPLRDSWVNVQGLLAVPRFSLFGGTAVLGQPTPAAFTGPHADVHNAFAYGNVFGDMSDLQYSPRDPVFYAHHGNIDRLWSSWVAAAPSHTNPDFGDAKVYFYDETRTWRYVLMNDLRDESKLGYRYSSLMKPKAPLASLRTMAAARTANRVTLGGPVMERVAAPGPDFLMLENIRDLEKLPADVRSFGVFHGTPQVGAKADTAPGFLGVVSRVLSVGHDHGAAPLSAALEVTDKLGKVAAGARGTLDLTVAPLDADGKVTAAAIPLRADNVEVVS